ncbi:MAG: hypothetical protein K8S55_02720 [Phycisphaerae bacterium]|nr:hypothetical protein [Phycisphaerae bacterium]
MKTILQQKLRLVRRHCSLNLLLEQARLWAGAAGVIFCLAVLAEKLWAVEVFSLWSISIATGVLTAGVLACWLLRRPTTMQAALLLDERLRTQERFSTALALADDDDPFAEAAIREAMHAAGNFNPTGKFPIRPNRRWYFTPAGWLLAAAMLLWMPSMDLLGSEAQQKQQALAEQKQQTAKKDVKQAAKMVETHVQKLGDTKLNADLAKLGDISDVSKPGDMRRQAIRKLSDLSEKIRKMQSGKNAKATAALQRKLRGLRGCSKGKWKELNRAIAKGQFNKAAEMIRDMQKQLAENKLTEEQKRDLAEQLADMGKQLQGLADDQKLMDKALDQAGVDRQQLNDALRQAGQPQDDITQCDEQALRDALKKQGLSDQQIDELLDKARAACNACKMCKKMGQSCSQAGDMAQLTPDELADLLQQIEAMEGMAGELTSAEESQAAIRAAITQLGGGKCDGGMACAGQGAGPWQPGNSQNAGGGSGGPGRGSGPRATDEGGQTKTSGTLSRSKLTKGKIVASWYFKGRQVKGKSRRELAEVTQAAKDSAAEAITEKQIPRRYEKAVKKYFGELQQTSKKKEP